MKKAFHKAALFCIAAVLALQQSIYALPLLYGGEVMVNGGFEMGTLGGEDGWILNNCYAEISETARTGKYSAQVTTTDADISMIKKLTALELDAWYEISVYIKLIDVPQLPPGESVVARFVNNHYTTYTDKTGNRVTGATDVEHLGLKFFPIAQGEWQKISYVYTPQSWDSRWGTDPLDGSGYLYLQCDVFSNGGGTGHKTPGYPITYLLDDFSVRKLKPNNISISGSGEILIPQDGQTAEQYTAYETIELETESCPWFQGDGLAVAAVSCPDGVRFQDGVLTVTAQAQPGEITLQAGNGEITAQKTIRLVNTLSDTTGQSDRRRISDTIRQGLYLYNTTTGGNKPALYSALEAAETQRTASTLTVEAENAAVSALTEEIYNFLRSVAPYREVYVKSGAAGGDGSQRRPFGTIAQARAYIQTITPNMTGDIIVHLAGGEYVYDQAAEAFGPADSGRNGFSVIYQGEEDTVISGGRAIEPQAWTPYTDSIYRAYIGPGETIRQLYVNGSRAVRARSSGGLSDARFENGGYITSDTFLLEYARPQDLEFVYVNAWTNQRGRGKSVAPAGDGSVQVFVTDKSYENTVAQPQNYLRYYENAYELLDAPGEWYYNSETGYIYYMPLPAETVINAVYPVRNGELFWISGTDENNVVHDLEFRNLQFCYAAWNMPSGELGYIDNQDNHPRMEQEGVNRPPAAVTVHYGQNIQIRDCTFAHLGSIGVNMEFAVQNCDIRNNTFRDISANGITVGTSDYYRRIDYTYPQNYYYLPADEKYYIRDIDICDNTLSQIAVEYGGSAAISAGYLIDSQIAYNDICETAYSAVHVNWGWEYIDTSCTSNMQIHHNYIENALNSYMADGGAIYVLGPTSGKIRCSIHDNYLNGMFSKSDVVYGSAIYLDEGSSYWDVYRNVVDLSKTNPSFFMTKSWLSSLDGGKHDNHVYENYITEYARLSYNQAKNNQVWGTHIFSMDSVPAAAAAIMEDAGVRGKE